MAGELDYDPALVTWLRAQLDEDERVAREAASSRECGCHPGANVTDWRWRDPHVTTEMHTFLGGEDWTTAIDDEVGKHIARWDPARVLAEVEAKRKLIDELIEFVEGDHAPWNDGYLKLLAQPYANREGFRDEWRYEDVD